MLVLTTSAKEGYAIYKSVPYGSVEDTVPYLVRRAQENRTVLQGIRKERDLLKKEFYRRLRLSSWSPFADSKHILHRKWDTARIQTDAHE